MEKNRGGAKHEEVLWIVTSTHGDGPRLTRAVRSLLDQTDASWRWLLIDDGSPPGQGTEWILPCLNGQVHLIRHKDCKGKAHRLNEALSYVESGWCLELDGDDWLFPDTVRIARGLVRSRHDAGFIYGDRLLHVPDRQGAVRPLRWMKGPAVLQHRSWRADPYPLGPRLYKLEVLKEAGGWPEHGFGQGRFYEDIELMDILLSRFGSAYEPNLKDCVLLRKNGITGRHRHRWKEFVRYLNEKEG